MSPPSTRKAESHERILEVAARELRKGGFEGVAVADVMKKAGLTHGGFYAHFDSRQALVAEALRRAGRDSAASLSAGIARRRAEGASPLAALVDSYLAEAHLAGPESGCPVAALASEMPRQSGEVVGAAAERVRALVALVKEAMPPGRPRSEPTVIASTMLGALQLARAIGDEKAGRAALAAARDALKRHYDTP